MTDDRLSKVLAPNSHPCSSDVSVVDGGVACGDRGGILAEWDLAVQSFGSETAVDGAHRRWTFSELDQQVSDLAATLQRDGVGPGDRIGVSLKDRSYWPLALLAVLRSGGIYVPLDLKLPEARRRAMVGDAGLKHLLSDSRDAVDAFELAWTDIGQREDGLELEPVDADGVFAILYTSGSTGTPKGVMLDHRGVVNEVNQIARLLDLGPGDRMVQFSSPGFDASLEELLSCLLHGATLVPVTEQAMSDFSAFSDFVGKERISILDLPTAFLTAWCQWMSETRSTVPKGLRAVITGGERLSAQAVRDWCRSGAGQVALWNSYGPTEASIVATVQKVDVEETEDPPIGRPLPGYQVRLDRQADEEWGELWIGGVGVGPGYWQRPEQEAKVFCEWQGERWYRTGDLAKWDARERLIFGGRKDDQLKIRGHRIEPDEVIRQLEAFPAVSAAHIGAVEAPSGTVLAGWIRWDGQAPDDWSKILREHLRGSLPEASVPTRWALVDEFKLTERGKLDRRALPVPGVETGKSTEDPVTAAEKRLAGIWSDLLGVLRVGREDDFFELGGSSLLALRLFGRISSNFGVRLPMSELLRASDLRSLAALVDGDADRAPTNDGLPPVIPLRQGEGSDLLFCVHGGDGGVLFYRELARHLPERFGMLTVESPELSVDGEVVVGTIEEMAARYLDAVRARQPTGPYRLAGYSFGGAMVYEMARQLLEQGERVEFLGLFDTENPAMKWRKYGKLERMRVYWTAHSDVSLLPRIGFLLSRTLEGVATNFRVKSEINAAAKAGKTEPHSQLRMLQVREAHGAAMDAYLPRPIDLEAVLFRTEAVDDKFEVATDYGWRSLVRELRIVDVPGEHLTMFEIEYVEDLARRLGEHL